MAVDFQTQSPSARNLSSRDGQEIHGHAPCIVYCLPCLTPIATRVITSDSSQHELASSLDMSLEYGHGRQVIAHTMSRAGAGSLRAFYFGPRLLLVCLLIAGGIHRANSELGNDALTREEEK